jgi:uncharacterized protein YqcC (DUF446 family)
LVAAAADTLACMTVQDRTSNIRNVVDAIAAEMRRIGYWSMGEAPRPNPQVLFFGMTFEKWLQFEYLPKVRQACSVGDESVIPPYRVGLAALRQYDYHSYDPTAQQLLLLCNTLEKLLGGAP